MNILRIHPLCPFPILGRPQNPGSQRSHLSPPTPGLQGHCLEVISQASKSEPSL